MLLLYNLVYVMLHNRYLVSTAGKLVACRSVRCVWEIKQEGHRGVRLLLSPGVTPTATVEEAVCVFLF